MAKPKGQIYFVKNICIYRHTYTSEISPYQGPTRGWFEEKPLKRGKNHGMKIYQLGFVMCGESTRRPSDRLEEHGMSRSTEQPLAG